MGVTSSPNFPVEDYLALKAIDRVFWLRYIALEKEMANSNNATTEQIALKKKYEADICPFDDPRETGTITGKYRFK